MPGHLFDAGPTWTDQLAAQVKKTPHVNPKFLLVIVHAVQSSGEYPVCMCTHRLRTSMHTLPREIIVSAPHHGFSMPPMHMSKTSHVLHIGSVLRRSLSLSLSLSVYIHHHSCTYAYKTTHVTQNARRLGATSPLCMPPSPFMHICIHDHSCYTHNT